MYCGSLFWDEERTVTLAIGEGYMRITGTSSNIFLMLARLKEAYMEVVVMKIVVDEDLLHWKASGVVRLRDRMGCSSTPLPRL